MIYPGSYPDSIRKFLQEVSKDFIPSLDSRTPDDVFFRSESESENTLDGVNYYFYVLSQQYNTICAYNEKNLDHILGIISFTEKESFCFPGKKCIYISTIAISPSARSAGIGKALLNKFFEYLPSFVSGRGKINLIETRTWSTNHVSIELFKKAGFSVCKKIENHRGEGIHTFYLVRPLEK